MDDWPCRTYETRLEMVAALSARPLVRRVLRGLSMVRASVVSGRGTRLQLDNGHH